MTKSCFKKSSQPTCFRVTFNKVVGVQAEQHGSTKKAIQETIQTLEKLHERVSINKGAITTIGAYYVSNKKILDTIDWGTKIWDARNLLKASTK